MNSKSWIGALKSFIKRWEKDYSVKTITGSTFSFGITVLFALYNGFLGIHLKSIWHGSICVFYLFLVTIRGVIIQAEKSVKSKSESEKSFIRYRAFKFSATILLLFNFALICPIVMMVRLEKPIDMGLIPGITMAAYTTYKVTMASVHFHKQHRIQGNVLIAELRTINFVDSLVSIITLQNTLIMVNSAKSGVGSMLVLSAVSGAVIYAVIVFVTIRMLVNGTKQHNKPVSSNNLHR